MRKITKKDKEKRKAKKLVDLQKKIIDLLLYFRHINQQQIQEIIHNNNDKKIQTLLRDLINRGYISEIPSEYCLNRGSRLYLKEKGIPERLIKRVYKEKTNSRAFRERSILLITIYISLIKLTEQSNAALHFYTKDQLHNLQYLIYPHPDCYFSIRETDGKTARYFLDIFDNEKFTYKRVYQHLDYFQEGRWQNHTKKSYPKIILVCSSSRSILSLHKFIQNTSNSDSPSFYLTTKEKIQRHGINKNVLIKVE